MPTSLPRCAMKPLKIVDQIPSPALDPADEGTLRAWSGLLVHQLGAGLTDATCTLGYGTSVKSLLNIIGGVGPSTVYPHQDVVFLPSAGKISDKSHTCPGDSGGPVLTGHQATWGTNIPADQVVSHFSSDELLAPGIDTGGTDFGPVLQSQDLRTWLRTTALDRDGDGVEAADDNCDTVYNPDQADSDADGIGDPCDAIEGVDDCADPDHDLKPNYMDPCPNGGSEANPDGDEFPNCTDPCPEDPTNTDPDGDHLCAGDDNCPLVSNPGQQNCNADAEIAASVAPRGDVCDAVPCVRAAQTSTTASSGGAKLTRTTFFDVEPIYARSNPQKPAKIRAQWGHRTCPCIYANGTTGAPANCDQFADCTIGDGVLFAANGPKWQFSKVATEGPPTLDATLTDFFAAPAEMQPGGIPATLKTLEWDPEVAALQFEVKASHWFHVRKEVCKGTCSGVTQTTIDQLASHYWAGAAGQYVALTKLQPIRIFDWWMPPDCAMCGLELMPFLDLRSDQSLAVVTRAGDYPIDVVLTALAAEALRTTTSVRWLAPAEPAGLLDGALVRMASVTFDGAGAGPALVATAQGLDLAQGARGLESVVVPASSTPPPRSRFGAVLRATEGDLLLVGGELEGGALARDLWRYDIGLGAWAEVPSDGSTTPGAVHAVTYDAFARRLVVLDEALVGAALTARLWTLDVDSGATRVHGSFGRTGFHESFALGAVDDGSFVLLAAYRGHRGEGDADDEDEDDEEDEGDCGEDAARLAVVRLKIYDGSVTVERVRRTTGTPVSAPRTNQRGVHILVDRGAAGIVADRIDWSRLKPAHGRTLADFVD
ncbi:MAG: thrombospondin type 3 repeat-containing protein [Acidobacteria bacterium]|nr:thrombospondin type 3 repeat-containing protein [Acidobacteriota bacterium]